MNFVIVLWRGFWNLLLKKAAKYLINNKVNQINPRLNSLFNNTVSLCKSSSGRLAGDDSVFLICYFANVYKHKSHTSAIYLSQMALLTRINWLMHRLQLLFYQWLEHCQDYNVGSLLELCFEGLYTCFSQGQ